VASSLAMLASPAAAQPAGSEVVADGLEFAVNMAFLPDGRILIAEKGGAVRVVDDGELRDRPLATLPANATNNETGLLGLAVDPSFPEEPWVYAYLSDATDGLNKLVRFPVDGMRAGSAETLFDAIATTGIHNGGDLAFGGDRSLFLVTGDGAEESRSQDPDDPHGKVLRFDLDRGGAVTIHASGIRNSFGVCVDPRNGDLFQTENGPSAWDEINRVDEGANLGWPSQLGPGGEPTYVDPLVGFEDVVVLTGCATAGFARDGLYATDYRGQLHHVVRRDDGIAVEVVSTFDGGATDVAFGPDGALYVLTTDTLYRSAAPDEERDEGPNDGPDGGTSEPSGPGETPTATPVVDDGFGSALGTTGGIVVLAVFALGFLWLRGRALRR
jgi:glucose/arabinose dehydrogenase